MAYFLVIPAAGKATRAMAFTGFGTTPKPFISIGGNTVFGLIMEEARSAKIDELALIVDSKERANLYKHYFDPFLDAPELKENVAKKAPDAIARIEKEQQMNVHYTYQQEPLGFGHAVGLVYPIIKEKNHDGIIVALGDDLICSKSSGMEQLIEVHKKTGGMVCMLEKVTREDAKRFGVAQISEILDSKELTCQKLFRVGSVQEKPQKPTPNIIDEQEFYFAIAGRYLLEEEDLEYLFNAPSSKGDELDFSSLFARNIAKGRLTAILPEGNFHTVGNSMDLQKAAISFALHSDNSNVFDELLTHTLHELYSIGVLHEEDSLSEKFSLNPTLAKQLKTAILSKK